MNTGLRKSGRARVHGFRVRPCGPSRNDRDGEQYESPEISGHECAFDVRPPSSASYRGGRAGAQLTAQSERIRSWLVANRFQAISQASMMSVRLTNTELASQWLRR